MALGASTSRIPPQPAGKRLRRCVAGDQAGKVAGFRHAASAVAQPRKGLRGFHRGSPHANDRYVPLTGLRLDVLISFAGGR